MAAQAGIEALHARILEEISQRETRRLTTDDEAPANTGTVVETGTIRTRDQFEDGQVMVDEMALRSVFPGVFTLEDGRAMKRHKNLSPQSDTDAEKFLKVSQHVGSIRQIPHVSSVRKSGRADVHALSCNSTEPGHVEHPTEREHKKVQANRDIDGQYHYACIQLTLNDLQ